MKALIVLTLLINTCNSYSQEIVGKSCGKCGKAVSSDSQIGDTCPFCGVKWDDENSTTSHISQFEKGGTSQKTISKDPLTYKYTFIVKSDNAKFYSDRAGNFQIGSLQKGERYVGNTIEEGFVELIRPNDQLQWKLGWSKVSDLRVLNSGDKHSDEDYAAVFQAIGDEAYKKINSQKDPFESKFELADPLNAGKTIHYGESNAIVKNTDKQASTDNLNHNQVDEKPYQPDSITTDAINSIAKDLDASIKNQAKEEGSKIYWKSLTTNILIMVAGAIIFLVIFNSSKNQNS
jgi:hypothetical protein